LHHDSSGFIRSRLHEAAPHDAEHGGSRRVRTEPTDEELMLATGRGDLHAFEQLVLRHQQSAWNAAYRFLGDAAGAEDLVQEAFLRILDAAERYEPTALFRTYLLRVLTRLCLDYARKMCPLVASKLPDRPDGGPTPEQQIIQQDRDLAIQAALNALPPNQRLAAVLRYFDGLSGAEIAAAMGVTTKAVERLLARARDAMEPRLAHLLEE